MCVLSVFGSILLKEGEAEGKPCAVLKGNLKIYKGNTRVLKGFVTQLGGRVYFPVVQVAQREL